MNIDKLEVGMTVKNYKAMCELLEENIQAGNSKVSQMKEWSRYFSFSKNGNSFIIEEIYKEPLKKINNYKGGNKLIKTPLTVTNPRLANQWDKYRNGEITDIVVKTSKDKYWWKCDICNQSIYASPYKRFNKCLGNKDEHITCPNCWMSKDAKKIYKTLIDNNIEFEIEYTFDDLLSPNGNKLRFDFALFKEEVLSCLIEYDGSYHDTEDVFTVHDKIKDEYCINNNIPLLRIHHTDSALIMNKLYKFLKLLNYELKLDYFNIDDVINYKYQLENELQYHLQKIESLNLKLKELVNV